MRINTSLAKGLRLIEALAAARRGLKLAELARAIESPSSNATLFINTLIEGGYLIRDGRDGLYHLSGKLGELAKAVETDLIEELKAMAEEEMTRLHELYDENVVLSVLSRHHLSAVVEIPSTQAIRIVNRQQDLFIPHVTAAGKAMLAFLSERKRQAYLNQAQFPALTSNSCLSLECLGKELHQIYKRGWASNLGEYDPHIFGVAAPILRGKEAIAAVVVQYPSFRHSRKNIKAYALEVMQSANAITAGFAQRAAPKS